jgi:PAS domain S-box-containing protein
MGACDFMTDQPTPISEEIVPFGGADALKLVDSVVDYALYLLDLDGAVRSWNPGAQRIKGYRAEEIIGRDFSVFYTEDDISAGERARALRMARTTGRFEAEGWRVREDGSRFWASVVIDAVSDSAGAITGFAKITRDATRHLAERVAFDEEAAKCRIIFEAAPNGMLIVDETGIVTLANARADTIFGYPPGGLLEVDRWTFLYQTPSANRSRTNRRPARWPVCASWRVADSTAALFRSRSCSIP